MAEKKGYIVYFDFADACSKLSDEDAGRLFKAMTASASGEKIELDGALGALLSFFDAKRKKADEAYAETCKKRAEAGKQGGRPQSNNNQSQANETNKKQNKANAFTQKQTKAKKADTDTDTDNIKETLSIESVKKSAARFSAPTVEEVAAYCSERRNGVDAERFCDFYASKGWKIGKEPMKDWKAAVRTWEKNGIMPKNKASSAVKSPQSFDVGEFYEKALRRAER